jgi:hypothetical protein
MALNPATLQAAQELESLLLEARKAKFADLGAPMDDEIYKHTPLAQINIEEFITAYLKAGVFPSDRLDRLVGRLMDIKILLYDLVEVELGHQNPLLFNLGFNPTRPWDKPHLLMTRLSLDLSLILKSRVLWDRIMNFLYDLETGEELENKVTGRKSKKRVFFDHMLSCPKWRFLEPYGPMLQRFDETYRTPESHKFSVLRAELMNDKIVTPHRLVQLIDAAYLALWQNVMSIINGGQATQFTELHVGEDGQLDPKYQQVGQDSAPSKT